MNNTTIKVGQRVRRVNYPNAETEIGMKGTVSKIDGNLISVAWDAGHTNVNYRHDNLEIIGDMTAKDLPSDLPPGTVVEIDHQWGVKGWTKTDKGWVCTAVERADRGGLHHWWIGETRPDFLRWFSRSPVTSVTLPDGTPWKPTPIHPTFGQPVHNGQVWEFSYPDGGEGELVRRVAKIEQSDPDLAFVAGTDLARGSWRRFLVSKIQDAKLLTDTLVPQ